MCWHIYSTSTSGTGLSSDLYLVHIGI